MYGHNSRKREAANWKRKKNVLNIRGEPLEKIFPKFNTRCKFPSWITQSIKKMTNAKKGRLSTLQASDWTSKLKVHA